MGSKFLIYALSDPRTDEIRYIGKSSYGLKRPKSHTNVSMLKANTYKTHWIKSLLRDGVHPKVVVLEAVDDRSSLNEFEKAWIQKGRALGWRLTNATDGGDGLSGHKPSLETRAKLSKRMLGNKRTLGYKHTAQARANMSASLLGNKRTLGYKHTEENKKKMSARMFGNTHTLGLKTTPEVKAKLSAKLAGNKNSLGHKHTEEAKAKMSMLRKGRKMSDTTKAKMSAAQMGNTKALGYQHTVEARAKISAALTGRQNTWGDKISAAKKGKMSAEARAKLSAVAKIRMMSRPRDASGRLVKMSLLSEQDVPEEHEPQDSAAET